MASVKEKLRTQIYGGKIPQCNPYVPEGWKSRMKTYLEKELWLCVLQDCLSTDTAVCKFTHQLLADQRKTVGKRNMYNVFLLFFIIIVSFYFSLAKRIRESFHHFDSPSAHKIHFDLVQGDIFLVIVSAIRDWKGLVLLQRSCLCVRYREVDQGCLYCVGDGGVYCRWRWEEGRYNGWK